MPDVSVMSNDDLLDYFTRLTVDNTRGAGNDVGVVEAAVEVLGRMKRLKLEVHDDPNGEWAALYVDGALDIYGDRHNIVDRALQLAGVEFVENNAFLLGTDGRDGVAKTLDEISSYRERRHRIQMVVRERRRQAAQLLAEADQLEKQG